MLKLSRWRLDLHHVLFLISTPTIHELVECILLIILVLEQLTIVHLLFVGAITHRVCIDVFKWPTSVLWHLHNVVLNWVALLEELLLLLFHMVAAHVLGYRLLRLYCVLEPSVVLCWHASILVRLFTKLLFFLRFSSYDLFSIKLDLYCLLGCSLAKCVDWVLSSVDDWLLLWWLLDLRRQILVIILFI